MNTLKFERLQAERRITTFGSIGFEVLAFLPQSRVTLARLEAGGRIGRHTAPVEQLFLVVSGKATVESGDQIAELTVGQAVLFNVGEDHQTTTEDGFVAVVVESSDLAQLLEHSQ